MKKKVLMGALVLSATAFLSLVGCGDKPDAPQTPSPEAAPQLATYTVTFDHDNNPLTENIVVEYTEGDKHLIGKSNYNKVISKEVDGYAVQWDTYSLNNEDIVVTGKFGDGSVNNPYLISTGKQLAQVLRDYSTLVKQTEYTLNGEASEEVLANKKVEYYKAVTLTYTRTSTDADWGVPTMKVTSTPKQYYKLISDIHLGNTGGNTFRNEVSSGRINLKNVYFNGEFDGEGHSLSGMNGDIFVSTEGAMFNTIVGATFKNLKINLDQYIGSIAGVARYGVNQFNNIEIRNTGNPVVVRADDNNESPFIFHAIGAETTLNFVNCTNFANINSAADYHGLFLGGYAKDANVSFENCINKGTIKSIGSVGMLIGNGHYNPSALTIVEKPIMDEGDEVLISTCKNEGRIITQKQSHILVSNMKGSGLLSQKIEQYDKIYNADTNALEAVEFETLVPTYSATIDENSITVSNKDTTETINAGKYQLILSAFALNDNAGTGYRTIRLNIVVDNMLDEQSENLTFADVYHGFIDLNTYNLINSTTITSDATWERLSGYNNIKYKLLDGYYVFDFSEYEQANNISHNKMVVNVAANSLSKQVVVYEMSQSKITNIQCIAQFN